MNQSVFLYAFWINWLFGCYCSGYYLFFVDAAGAIVIVVVAVIGIELLETDSIDHTNV